MEGFRCILYATQSVGYMTNHYCRLSLSTAPVLAGQAKPANFASNKYMLETEGDDYLYSVCLTL